jgi:phosphatidylinositol alpha-mannosyltransferase
VHYLVGETKRTDIENLKSLSRNVKVKFNQNRMAMPLPVSYRRIKTLLDAEKFDVLHVQVPYSPLMAGKIIKAAGPKTAVVGTFHILPHSPLVVAANHLLGLWSKSTLKRFDVMTATSAPTAVFAKKTFHINSQVMSLPIELEKFSGAQPFAKYKNGLNVLFLGRLVERKGCQYLLKAVAYVKKRGAWPEKAKVTICGAGHLEVSLKKYVNDHALQDIVEFTGFISEADKPKYLAGADVVAYPSTGGESFGIVLLEAMAASRGIVLAGNNPGYASVMAPRPSSLFNPKDTKQLSGLLTESLNNADLRKQANAWQKQYIKNFDLEKVGKQTIELYNKALNNR